MIGTDNDSYLYSHLLNIGCVYDDWSGFGVDKELRDEINKVHTPTVATEKILRSKGLEYACVIWSPITVNTAGYLFVYSSKKSNTTNWVSFDDLRINVKKSDVTVIQRADYYPFGLAFNSYSRENSVANKNLFNRGSELGNAGDGEIPGNKFLLNGKLVSAEELMSARAKAIYNFLIDRGVDPKQLQHNAGKVSNGSAGYHVTLDLKKE